ncbi:hypothetical protein B0H67DRAFT_586847 [Lasiosphaeris hirsuta]|uniref:LTD domain-containing protein n=1 Tax=Lasiosphaeris hirsuta TaxID=260670 RepID=A0AA40AA07_9PEZI|nr:hypothetical protein B0H67DRAFT_586847 [Lasiosphaeris hirsuta]
MPVNDYGVWKARPVSFTYEGRDKDPKSPHLSLIFTDNENGRGRAAINIKSGDQNESRLTFWSTPKINHPITTDLAKLDYGFKPLGGTAEQAPGGLALDFIRGNLFQRTEGRILPHDVDGPDNDILDQLKPTITAAIAQKATIYLFGSAFNNGKGIHNVHMNQGNPQRFARDNGVYQDGALLIQFADHWAALFIGFASQAVHTDDETGQPVPRTGYLTWANFLSPEVPPPTREEDELADSPVAIVQALVNTPGPDGHPSTAPETVTLANRTAKEVDLSGWRIRNKTGQHETLSEGLSIAAEASLMFEVPRAPLSNAGGTITLLNGEGLKVYGVSYSKEQAAGGTVSWG